MTAGDRCVKQVPVPAPRPSTLCEMLRAGLTVRDIARLYGVADHVIARMMR